MPEPSSSGGKLSVNLSPSEVEAAAAQPKYWFDAEQFTETQEQWEVTEKFVRTHPESLKEWYTEEEGTEPESLKPDFLIKWLHELAALE